MNDYANTIKAKMDTIIAEMSESVELFVKTPGKDFTRNRKIPFDTFVHYLISMGGNSVYKELLEANGYDLHTATTSAFVQQRDKVLPFAFEFLLHEFTSSFTAVKKHRDYRLLAVDGSDLHIATNPNDPDTYFENHPGEKGYNLLHLNAFYNLCNRFYLDLLIQPRRDFNEGRALIDMVGRSRIKDKTIIIADRGYESYNVFAHIESKGWNYVIRVKDLGSNGILSGLTLPAEGEFDVTVHRRLTRKQTKEVRENPEIYKFMPANQVFDFLKPKEKGFYTISFRIVRILIADGSYETIITNLSVDDFPSLELKELYALRWGIETAFRVLKHTIGLTRFHAKKQEYISQEIFARVILYNFTEMITSHVVISHADTKLSYQVNFTVAVLVCRHFLRSWFNIPPPDVEALIRKNTLPIRPGRKYIRKIRSKSTVSFVYRVA